MLNYPHINDNLLQVLENSNLIFLDERDQACSLVVRLAPETDKDGKYLPLRFEKRSRIINGAVDDQVDHELSILKKIKRKGINIQNIVSTIEYTERETDYILITKDVGVDANNWLNIPLFLRACLRSF